MLRSLFLAMGISLGLLPTLANASDASDQKTPIQTQLEAQEEGRFDKSSRLISEAFFNIDDDLKGIALYPFEHPKEALLFLGGIGALVAVDKPVTRYYQDKVEPIFNGYSIKTPKLAKGLGLNKADGYLVL
ncbi:phosphoesterase, partial [Pseudomonadota bacterium]